MYTEIDSANTEYASKAKRGKTKCIEKRYVKVSGKKASMKKKRSMPKRNIIKA